jgi:D-alanyl-lipoteichoic acid acyltransferase DltB (MBOAT superfamily)
MAARSQCNGNLPRPLRIQVFLIFTNNVIGLTGLVGWQLSGPSIEIILPIGLSFHTFQSLSYVIEVYRGRQKAERNFVTYATYVMGSVQNLSHFGFELSGTRPRLKR